MASSNKRKLFEEEVLNTILESDDDLSSYVDTEDEIGDRDEVYLINASAIDTESEGDDPGNLSASSNDNDGVFQGDHAQENHVCQIEIGVHMGKQETGFLALAILA
ncbi:hypothetical protein SNE40_019816 [Patella caerulea]|uniref:Uncharacterized protein n=1 Tax=Patella caerulea TaxID=87958 RepID=A0AAN8IZX6_PATCE